MNPQIDVIGTKRWHNELGQLHRTGGPAVIYTYGDQVWYFNDKLHRTDGPAITLSGGTQEYWIHGHKLTEEEYYDIIQSEEHLNWYLLQIL